MTVSRKFNLRENILILPQNYIPRLPVPKKHSTEVEAHRIFGWKPHICATMHSSKFRSRSRFFVRGFAVPAKLSQNVVARFVLSHSTDLKLMHPTDKNTIVLPPPFEQVDLHTKPRSGSEREPYITSPV